MQERTAAVLGVSKVRIALGEHPRASAHESPHQLTVEGRTIGVLYTPEDEEPALGPSAGSCQRSPPSWASR